ncbi:MAG: hypothetical protein ACJ8H8_24260 [Geminicoccaceae bacterium]
MRSLVRWLAVLTGGVAAGLCVALLYLKVQQENLRPTLLLKIASATLIGLPWLLATGRHVRHRRS